MLDFCVEMIFGGAGGPGALQTSSIGGDCSEAGNSGFCGTRAGRRRIFELPQGFNARGSWRGRAPSRPLRWEKTVPGREVPTSAERGRGGGGYSNFRKGLMPGGAGGPGALQTSPPVRSQKSVDTDPHAALAGLTCRASPANSSIAGGAALDSVRLRRNRSLLLCGTQSSPLTCARGADRAWAREKTETRWKFPSQHSNHA